VIGFLKRTSLRQQAHFNVSLLLAFPRLTLPPAGLMKVIVSRCRCAGTDGSRRCGVCAQKQHPIAAVVGGDHGWQRDRCERGVAIPVAAFRSTVFAGPSVDHVPALADSSLMLPASAVIVTVVPAMMLQMRILPESASRVHLISRSHGCYPVSHRRSLSGGIHCQTRWR